MVNQYVIHFQEFLITLQEPVPQPNKHEGKEWYHQNITRAEAEELLRRVPSDGAFLVRPSGNDVYSYAISFR
jgi:phosphatidylinositol phospholipase C gamma-1